MPRVRVQVLTVFAASAPPVKREPVDRMFVVDGLVHTETEPAHVMVKIEDGYGVRGTSVAWMTPDGARALARSLIEEAARSEGVVR